jgi:formiminotetrahydrofolate cyclodeaminase
MREVSEEDNDVIPLQMLSTDDAIREFNMFMNEKVKKDLLEKKNKGKVAAGGSAASGSSSSCSSSFLDFICAVTLTNKNSIKNSQTQIESFLRRMIKLVKEKNPYGDLAVKLLGM